VKQYYVRLKSGGYKIESYKNLKLARVHENIKTNYNVDIVRAATQKEIDLYEKEKGRTTL